VHAVQGWPDLRRRLQADRRCYAFFHPQLPDEPIIFIEVALTHGMSARVQPLLDVGAPVGDPMKADCAMFYSITNCQEGLRGISFGNQLIKQVAEDLKLEFPHLKRFATLSPIPGLRRWLETNAAPELVRRIADPAWHLGEIPEALQGELMRLCAYYLVRAKEADGEPLDPVARFHLGNGASLERLNFLGDSSESGMARSAGLMANYVYALPDLEKNHERYFRSRLVSASAAVDKLARDCKLPGQDAA
jgi:malonyl-CoA decarboxylase